MKPTSQQEKKFEEERARRILKYLFPEEYNESTLSEAPDIISVRSSIGVEVTSSMIRSVQEAMSRVSDISGKTDDMLTKINKDNINQGRVAAIKMDTGAHLASFVVWGNTHDIEAAYCKKLTRLNLPHYRLFNENNLFIYAWLIDDKELLNGLDAIYNKIYSLKCYLGKEITLFGHVYIIKENQFIKISSINNQIKKYILSNVELSTLAHEAFTEIFGISREDYYGS